MASPRNTILAAAFAFAAVVSGGLTSVAIGEAGSSATSDAHDYQPLTRAEAHEITSVNAKTFAAVGAGAVKRQKNQPPRLANASKLSQHGKPVVAYVLAEWCPYCAAENWSLAVALSRFGTLRNLTTMTSSAHEDPASVSTISFRHARLHSKYLVFDAIVYEDARMQRVDSVPRRVRPAWRHYGHSAFPFIDFAGSAVLAQSSYSPTLLAHLTRAHIAAALNLPKRRITKAIDGSANQLTAAICVATKQKPASVCRSKTIVRIRHSLK